MANPDPGRVLREKLQTGKRVVGTFIQYTTNPAIVDVIPPDAFDFVIVTCEHNALDLADFLPLRYALQGRGIACLARIHSRDPDDVAKVCDTFDGVVVPYVEDVNELRHLAAAAVYRPLKGAALETLLTTGHWPSEKSRQYVAERNANTVFVPMVESVTAMEHLDEICSVPGVHAVFVGPNDLTTSMGIPNEYDSPQLIDALQKIIDTADRSHVAAGCWFGKPDQMRRTINQGARFVVYGSDGLLMADGINASL